MAKGRRTKRCVLYIPGLGDRSAAERVLSRLSLKFWRLYGVHAEMVPVFWYDGRSYDEKLTRVITKIDEKIKQGYTVSLIGASAGASMALNAFAARPEVGRVVTIAGVNDPSAPIGSSIRKSAPALVDSCASLVATLKVLPLRRVDAIYAYSDAVVNRRHSIINGAHNHRVPSFGHLVTIALCLTLYSPYVLALVKRPS